MRQQDLQTTAEQMIFIISSKNLIKITYFLKADCKMNSEINNINKWNKLDTSPEK